jgi:hypothetical protein
MNSQTSESIDNFLRNPPNFSLVLGGPVFQVLRRSHLTDDALGHTRRRVIAISLFSWLPLLVFSALEGKMVGGSVAVPFCMDAEVHIRFLFVLPLLIVAELVVHQRMRLVATQFLERRLIPKSGIMQFQAAVFSAIRLRNSLAAEIFLFSFVYIFGILIVWRNYIALDTATWYATHAADGSKLSFAGMWFGFVSLPLFQFLLCRWYFRIFVWARFLYQVSRIGLSLVPAHPDRAGGLGFLSETVYAFIPLLIAHGALLAGFMGDRILHLGATLPEFVLEIVLLALFLICIVLGPLLVFGPQLADARRKALREYGSLAERYVRQFDSKWLCREAVTDKSLVGSGDIQSLADLGNSFEMVRKMRMVPFSQETILQLSVATVTPIVPLLLTMMPLETIFGKLLDVLF